MTVWEKQIAKEKEMADTMIPCESCRRIIEFADYCNTHPEDELLVTEIRFDGWYWGRDISAPLKFCPTCGHEIKLPYYRPK